MQISCSAAYAYAAMPKSMRPVVKIEGGEGEGQGAEKRQEEAGAGRAV